MIGTVTRLSEETIRWKPSEEEWSIMQILCHVVEAVPYWLGEIELKSRHSLRNNGEEITFKRHALPL